MGQLRERTAIIHIGTLKTGTTAIQFALTSNRRDLLTQGVAYSDTVGVQTHPWVALQWLAGTRGKQRLGGDFANLSRDQLKAHIERFKQRVADEMEALPAHVDRVVFSDERLSLSMRTPEDVAELHTLLAPFFDRFKIIIYLRQQASFLASRYTQQLRAGFLSPPDSIGLRPAEMKNYDYKSMIDTWAAVFGEHAMMPRLYERGARPGFDSIDDFAAAIDVRLQVKPTARNANPSLSAAGQAVMTEVGNQYYAARGKAEPDQALWRRLNHVLTRTASGVPWLPTRSEAAEFMARFEAMNEDIRKRFFPERPSLFLDESHRLPEVREMPSDRANFEAACRALLHVLANEPKAAPARPAPVAQNGASVKTAHQ
jgi:hypothetical protein